MKRIFQKNTGKFLSGLGVVCLTSCSQEGRYWKRIEEKIYSLEDNAVFQKLGDNGREEVRKFRTDNPKASDVEIEAKIYGVIVESLTNIVAGAATVVEKIEAAVKSERVAEIIETEAQKAEKIANDAGKVAENAKEKAKTMDTKAKEAEQKKDPKKNDAYVDAVLVRVRAQIEIKKSEEAKQIADIKQSAAKRVREIAETAVNVVIKEVANKEGNTAEIEKVIRKLIIEAVKESADVEVANKEVEKAKRKAADAERKLEETIAVAEEVKRKAAEAKRKLEEAIAVVAVQEVEKNIKPAQKKRRNNTNNSADSVVKWATKDVNRELT